MLPQTMHIVLTVHDGQPMKLSSYKRVILYPQA